MKDDFDKGRTVDAFPKGMGSGGFRLGAGRKKGVPTYRLRVPVDFPRNFCNVYALFVARSCATRNWVEFNRFVEMLESEKECESIKGEV
jgi:hypothetical protein